MHGTRKRALTTYTDLKYYTEGIYEPIVNIEEENGPFKL